MYLHSEKCSLYIYLYIARGFVIYCICIIYNIKVECARAFHRVYSVCGWFVGISVAGRTFVCKWWVESV